MPGLYRMIGQMKNGIIVESLDDGKRFPAFASHRISALEDISIYGDDEDVPLGEVFDKIHEKLDGGAIEVSSKGDEPKKFFEEVFPEYDRDRVYISDIKKVIKWYNQLLAKDLLIPDATDAEETAEEETAEEVSGEETTAEAQEETKAEAEETAAPAEEEKKD